YTHSRQLSLHAWPRYVTSIPRSSSSCSSALRCSQTIALAFAENCTRRFQIGRAIDAFWKIGDRIRADDHAHLKRAQLFELLALLKWRGWRCNEAGERIALVNIDADVPLDGAVAMGSGGAGEVEAAAVGGAHSLHDIWIAAIRGIAGGRHQRGDIGPVAQR